MALNHAIGPKTTRATEVQTMRSNSAPGHIYSVDVETVSCKPIILNLRDLICLVYNLSIISKYVHFQQTNADIPYADHFYVSTHYCIVKVRNYFCVKEARITLNIFLKPRLVKEKAC